MAEETNRRTAKMALGRLGVKLVVSQRLEHRAHVLEVLLAGLGENEYVITVHLHEAAEHRRACRRAAKDGVHVPHE